MAVSGGLLVINSIWRPRRSDRPPAASLPHRQHPGQQLPDARPSGSATRYRRVERGGLIRCVLGSVSLARYAASRCLWAIRYPSSAGARRRRRFRRRRVDSRAARHHSPAIETLLSVVDRQLDRQLATERYHTVHELMVGIDFERAKRRLPRELFLAMQSVPEEEAAQVSRPIDEIDRMDDLSSQDKSYLLGYYLLDLVGKEFLAAVLEDPNRRAEYLLSEAAPD